MIFSRIFLILNDFLSIFSKASKPPGLEVSGLEASSCLGGNREAKSILWKSVDTDQMVQMVQMLHMADMLQMLHMVEMLQMVETL